MEDECCSRIWGFLIGIRLAPLSPMHIIILSECIIITWLLSAGGKNVVGSVPLNY